MWHKIIAFVVVPALIVLGVIRLINGDYGHAAINLGLAALNIVFLWRQL